MKQTMIDLMSATMPYMKWPLWIGAGLVVIGIALIISQLVLKRTGPLKTVSWVLICIGAFYFACHAMGLWLGMTPKINFADATEFEFVLVPFWQLGAALLSAGVIFRVLSGFTPKTDMTAS